MDAVRTPPVSPCLSPLPSIPPPPPPLLYIQPITAAPDGGGLACARQPSRMSHLN